MNDKKNLHILPLIAFFFVLYAVQNCYSSSEQKSFIAKYWQALNRGFDVSSLESDLNSYIWHTHEDKHKESIEEKLSQQLDILLQSQPARVLVNSGGKENVVPNSNWSSMGGSASHTGFTNQTGPMAGIEVWRYPVGWDYKPQAIISDDKVYIATAALDTSMICYDLNTGQKLWSANNPHIGSGRQIRALDAIELSDKEIAVVKGTFDGWILNYIVISRENGAVLRQVPAIPQEKKFSQQEKSPKQLVAFRTEMGRSLLVKSLLSGRTWWKFPTGYQTDEPKVTSTMIFSPTMEGTLWAFNIYGSQRIAWSYTIKSSWGAKPTVSNKIIYAGANDGCVYGLEAATGRFLWKQKLSKPDQRSRKLFSEIAITEDRLYVGSTDGFLYCLDIMGGGLKWKHNCGEWIRAKPYVYGKMVFVATLNGELIAVKDCETIGKRVWEKRNSDYPIYSNLVGDMDTILVSNSNYDITVYSLKDGSQIWQHSVINCTEENNQKIYADSMPTIVQTPVIVSNKKVIIAGKDHFVVAINAETGKKIWRFETYGKVAAATTAGNGQVFIGQYGGNDQFYAVDEETGQPVWIKSNISVWASPEYQENQLFVGDIHGMFYCLNPNNGETLWQRKFMDGIYSAPALDENRVYTGSWDGHYYALDRNTGEVLWAYSPPGKPYHIGGRPDSSTPVLIDNKVIVPILGGRMVALNKDNGHQIWQWQARPWRICNVTAATNGDIVFVSTFGNAYESPYGVSLFGLNLNTGKELWQIADCGGLTSPIITSQGYFFTGSLNSPFIRAYQLSDQKNECPTCLWQFKTGGVMYESLPAISGNMGYFLSNDGYIHALR